ncbi:MAG: type II toxin-antitoxin system prevent-host-death family antitoxin [Kiritimatiellia bacterium]
MNALTTTVTVRDGKNRFSELVRRAARGEEITITSHGREQARLCKAERRGNALAVDWKWLRNMRVARRQNSSEQIVREDRNGRD